jgi:hypothetical protein
VYYHDLRSWRFPYMSSEEKVSRSTFWFCLIHQTWIYYWYNWYFSNVFFFILPVNESFYDGWLVWRPSGCLCHLLCTHLTNFNEILKRIIAMISLCAYHKESDHES